MKRFANILVDTVAVDDEPCRATRRAVELARKHQSALTLVGPVEDLPPYARVLLPNADEIDRLLTRDRIRSLERRAESARAEGLEVRVGIVRSRRARDLVVRVQQSKHDLVVKVADPPGALKRLSFGSVDLELLRKCPCPVWLLKDAPTHAFDRVLVAVDPDSDDDVRTALNHRLIELARGVAQLDGAELHVVHVRPVLGEHLLIRYVREDDLKAYLQAARKAAERALNELLAPYELSTANERVHLLHGEPGAQIVRQVEELGVDLLVMGTVARTGIAGLLIGNTAERVLRDVDCSVLAVKPEGFVSPVEFP